MLIILIVEPLILEETVRVSNELLGKLPLLLDHFGIPRSAPDMWQQLAFRLARNHVPGFQTVLPKKAGTPQDWGSLELAELYLEVGILTNQGMTAMDACRALVRLAKGRRCASSFSQENGLKVALDWALLEWLSAIVDSYLVDCG